MGNNMRFFDKPETHLETYRHFKDFLTYLRHFNAEFHLKPVGKVQQCLLHKFDKFKPIAGQASATGGNAESARQVLEEIHKIISAMLIHPKLCFLNANGSINERLLNSFANLPTVSDKKKFQVFLNFVNREMKNKQKLLSALTTQVKNHPQLLELAAEEQNETEAQQPVPVVEEEPENAADDQPELYPRLLQRIPREKFVDVNFAALYDKIQELIDMTRENLVDTENDLPKIEKYRSELRKKLVEDNWPLKILVFTPELIDLALAQKDRVYPIMFLLQEAQRLPKAPE